MKKRVVLVFAQRGGAGKSTVSRGTVDVLRHRGYQVEAWDGDATMGQLASLYGERDAEGQFVEGQSPLTGVGLFDVRNDRDRDALVAVGREGSWGAVIDLPAGSHADLDQVVPDGLEGLLTYYKQAGYEPVLLQVISPFRACAQSLFEIAPAIENSGAKWIVAANEFFAPIGDYVMLLGDERFDSAGAAAQRVEDAGGVIVPWPALRTRSYAYADAFRMSFREASLGPAKHPKFESDVLWLRRWLLDVDRLISTFGWCADEKQRGVA
jgi:hypothetical protein